MHGKTPSIVVMFLVSLLLSSAQCLYADQTQYLDLAESGRLMYWPDLKTHKAIEVSSWDAMRQQAKCVGVVWDEARDVRRIQLRLPGGKYPNGIKVQYWFHTWPPEPPSGISIEDPLDDLWQGKWLDAETNQTVKSGKLSVTFKPLTEAENPLAANLHGLDYRRTLKARLVFPDKISGIDSLRLFSESTLKPLSIRIEFGCAEKQPACWSGSLEIYNGRIVSVVPWNFEDIDIFEPPYGWKNVRIGEPKGLIVKILSANSLLPGSNDMTVVTVRARAKTATQNSARTFSFKTLDVEKGPVYIPAFHTYITLSDDQNPFSPKNFVREKKKIRDRIPLEPEQTYERAGSEIPTLNPWRRQHSREPIYLPLAADASWQKFAVQYDGNFYISKRGAKIRERKRTIWKGDRISYRIGTGEKPYYRQDKQVKVSVAEDSLPIIIHRWESDGLVYEQRSFVTLLYGPLDPQDPGRDETTPAVLMTRLQAYNPHTESKRANFWFKIKPTENLTVSDKCVFAESNRDGAYKQPLLRAVILTPDETTLKPVSVKANSLHAAYDVPAGARRSVHIHIPFTSDVVGKDVEKLKKLVFARQRKRVADYWRRIVDSTTRFTTPEPAFNHLARTVINHIHISATKDRRSGYYMAPASAYYYPVYANEACFQALFLDALGDSKRAARYLRPLMELQGTRSPVGNYKGPHDGVFYGVRVGKSNDYTAAPYGLHHGTVLWALAQHYLYSRDRQWLEQALPRMLRAVEWIERQRAITKKTDIHGRKVIEYGLLPAGRLEDNSDWGYWFANNAYCVVGMLDMARAMQDINHPEAERIKTQAQAYYQDLRSSVIRASELAPVVQMRDGTYLPYVPTRTGQRFGHISPLRVQYYSRYNVAGDQPCYRLSTTRELLYGPLILLNLGVFGPDEPIADWILDHWEDNLTLSSSTGFNVHGFTDDNLWFSQGGMVFQANLQNPILAYLKRREIPAAVRALYNNLVSCLFPDVHVLQEEYRQWVAGSGPFYKIPDEARFVHRLRDMLVLEADDGLWLAAGVPRRWLTSREGITVDRINSHFGTVTFAMRAGDEPGTIVATVEPPTRNKPENVWLFARIPGKRPIKSVSINGRDWKKIDAAQERILLPQTGLPLDVVIRY